MKKNVMHGIKPSLQNLIRYDGSGMLTTLKHNNEHNRLAKDKQKVHVCTLRPG
jgi:hypothetical protein